MSDSQSSQFYGNNSPDNQLNIFLLEKREFFIKMYRKMISFSKNYTDFIIYSKYREINRSYEIEIIDKIYKTISKYHDKMIIINDNLSNIHSEAWQNLYKIRSTLRIIKDSITNYRLVRDKFIHVKALIIEIYPNENLSQLESVVL